MMLHALLEYIPSAPYTYMGGLQLFAELLPLPIPMQTQEVNLYYLCVFVCLYVCLVCLFFTYTLQNK